MNYVKTVTHGDSQWTFGPRKDSRTLIGQKQTMPNALCPCGSMRKYKKCHGDIRFPESLRTCEQCGKISNVVVLDLIDVTKPGEEWRVTKPGEAHGFCYEHERPARVSKGEK